MEAMIHDKPSQRKTFAQHCSKGFVLGSSPEHYRCWNLWNTSTKETRVSGTVVFKHTYIINPETSPADAIISAANRMTETLLTHKRSNMCKEDLEALQRLEIVLSKAERTNSDVQIKSTPIRPSPRAQPTTSEQDKNKAFTAALEELAAQPRAKQKIFTDILEPAATPRVTNYSKRLVVACPRAVVVSNVLTIT